MFAPNRLLTTKEQWLLVGVIVAIITGCATLLMHDRVATPGTVTHSHPGTTIIPVPPQSGKAAPLAQPAIEQAPQQETTHAATVPVHGATSDRPKKNIGVAVMGAVRRPGLYFLEEDARVADLLAEAGGTQDNADLSDILLTAPVVDETTLTIPELPTVTRDGTQVSVRRSSVVVNPPWYRRAAAATAPRPAHPANPAQAAPAPAPALQQSAPSPQQPGLININTATVEELQRLPGIGPVFAARIVEERNSRPFATVEELKRVSGIAEKRLEAIRPLITVE